jgi:hypothetical protein
MGALPSMDRKEAAMTRDDIIRLTDLASCAG